MAHIETKVTEGFDAEGRVILSCEVWTNDGSELYGEVVYYSYSDEFVNTTGYPVDDTLFNAAVEAIKRHGALE